MSKYDEPWGDDMTVPTPAQWRRAKACVNACAGLDPAGIPELAKAAADVLSQFGDYQEMSFAELRLTKALAAVKEGK
jgi:hypothetical protein